MRLSLSVVRKYAPIIGDVRLTESENWPHQLLERARASARANQARLKSASMETTTVVLRVVHESMTGSHHYYKTVEK